jgi:hypothetical protein
VIKCINFEGQVRIYILSLHGVYKNSMHFLFTFIWGSFAELKYQMITLAKIWKCVRCVQVWMLSGESVVWYSMLFLRANGREIIFCLS